MLVSLTVESSERCFTDMLDHLNWVQLFRCDHSEFRFFSAFANFTWFSSSLCRCSLLYIDFEGRSDGESIKRILSLVNPRNLVSSLYMYCNYLFISREFCVAVDVNVIESNFLPDHVFFRFWCMVSRKPQTILLNTADKTLVYKLIKCLHRDVATRWIPLEKDIFIR